ncbi:hypothetical protein EDB85DRAFT_1896228 [Lactarius pseudohatsudake]|nr:hypothetical protein EDB85DRAFT_1896228 [Lactarius pseudohatsudake]
MLDLLLFHSHLPFGPLPTAAFTGNLDALSRLPRDSALDIFLKNRKWSHLEFLELVATAELSAGPHTVVEVRCGAGNAIFPLLEQNRNPKLHIHAFDYSSHAIKLVQHNTLYTSPPCGMITPSVWDLSSASPPPDLAPCSADILVLVFVLSALHPSKWPQAISNIVQAVNPYLAPSVGSGKRK